MAWPVRELKSWKEFRNLCDSIARGVRSFGATVLYRGNPRDDWQLTSSFLRMVKGISEEDALEIEEKARAHFLIESTVYAGIHTDVVWPSDRESRMLWWTIMQHYGAPTRLLDWTSSPYVAAYFAVENEHESPGAIWLFLPHYLHEAAVQDHGNDAWNVPGALTTPGAPSRIRPYYSLQPCSPRMTAQQGNFTVSTNVLADHGKLIGTTLRRSLRGKEKNRTMMRMFGTNYHICWRIPASLKPVFRHQLHQLNVTAAVLFPGVDGLGRSIDERVRLEAERALRKAAAQKRETP
jgi:hypothetical protein